MVSAGTVHESSLLLTLGEITQLVVHSHDPAETLTNIVRLIQGRFRTAVCSVYVLEPEPRELVLGATVGLKPEGVGRVPHAAERGADRPGRPSSSPRSWSSRRLQPPALQVLPRGRRGPLPLLPRRAADRGRHAAGRPGRADRRAAHLHAQRGAHAGDRRRPAGPAGRRRPAAGAGRRGAPARAGGGRRPNRSGRGRCTASASAPASALGQAYIVDGFDEWRRTVALHADDPTGESARLAAAVDAAREEITRLQPAHLRAGRRGPRRHPPGPADDHAGPHHRAAT